MRTRSDERFFAVMERYYRNLELEFDINKINLLSCKASELKPETTKRVNLMSKLAKLPDEISKTTRPKERNRLPDETSENILRRNPCNSRTRNIRKIEMEEEIN